MNFKITCRRFKENIAKRYTVKIWNIRTLETCYNCPKIWSVWFYHWVMCPEDTDGMANSVDLDQIAPSGAVWSETTLFPQTCLPENLGSVLSGLLKLTSNSEKSTIRGDELLPGCVGYTVVTATVICSEVGNVQGTNPLVHMMSGWTLEQRRH